MTVTLTDKQYLVLLDLYHECNDAHKSLPAAWRDAYQQRLGGRAKPATPAAPAPLTLSDRQYGVLLDLFHECNDAFKALPLDWSDVYYTKMYERARPIYAPKRK